VTVTATAAQPVAASTPVKSPEANVSTATTSQTPTKTEAQSTMSSADMFASMTKVMT